MVRADASTLVAIANLSHVCANRCADVDAASTGETAAQSLSGARKSFVRSAGA